MNSLLVTVLILASAANGSGGQSAVGKGWESVPVGLCPFPLRCTSAHHKLHMYTT